MRSVVLLLVAATPGCLAFTPSASRPMTPQFVPRAQVVAPISRTTPPVALTGLEGPALVSCAHVIVAMNLMPLGPTAYGLGMGGKVMSPGQRKWGDRAFGNCMEHFPLFNMALWMHALFCSPAVATTLGLTYVALTFMYPVFWALFGGEDGVPTKPYSLMPLFGPLKQIYYTTFPRYGIVFYLAFATVLKIVMGVSLNAIVKMPGLVAPLGFGYFLYHYAYGIYPFLQENVFAKAFAKA